MTKTIKEQTVGQLGGNGSVLARQRRDHAEIDRLMDHYALAEGDERERVLKEIVRLVFSHAFAEETVLWPVVRRSVADGEELTSRVEEEHQEINDLIAEVERLPQGDPVREEKIERAFSLIRQDIRDEEDVLLPRLQEATDSARLRRLGAVWEAARLTAPTHPHPVVPRRPPGNAVLGVPLSGYDRSRDLLGGPVGRGARKLLALAAGLLFAAFTAARRLRKRS
ncbi:hemerythrin domain-containing protein [Streptomyces botrytidirepellens]|uniref:Hemerythrin domain-containing protein n=1 Tax=Streptomyces botrytidirepellens TaxID=2486417 RepID=A0A3M8WM60_9ACTN|nr:hemerythrin domain-containing protein [Streptomyces botrytidirepellens]RNG30747.1 hemerythrin domain-containing protein [Streptomyces botrytidirepellens]